VGINGVAINERSVRERDVVFRASDRGEHRAWADVRGMRPYHRPAAFVAIAAVRRTNAERDRCWFRRRVGCVVMASRHRRGGGDRLAQAMVSSACRGGWGLSDGPGCCHRGERARDQDQQQEFGGPANHVFRVQKGRPTPRFRPSPTSDDRLRDRTEQQPVLRIGQFPAQYNPAKT